MVSIFWCLSTLLSTPAAHNTAHALCSGKAKYSPGSSFEANLKLLLNFLSSNATKNKGFYNASVGQGSTEVAYGLSHCRSDLGSYTCQTCVSEATQHILTQCPRAKQAAVWHEYNKCFVRYSDRSIVAINNETLGRHFRSLSSVKEDARFKQVLDSCLQKHKSI